MRSTWSSSSLQAPDSRLLPPTEPGGRFFHEYPVRTRTRPRLMGVPVADPWRPPMRLSAPQQRRFSSKAARFSAHPEAHQSPDAFQHPQATARQQAPSPARFDPSPSFLRDVRRVGLDSIELTQVIAHGSCSRRWDGCLLLQDRFLGIEVELDPSGTIGISARRIA